MRVQIKRLVSADRAVVGVMWDLGGTYMYKIWVLGRLEARETFKDYVAANLNFSTCMKGL